MNQAAQQARNALESEAMTTAARLADLSAAIIDAVRHAHICETRPDRTIDQVSDWLTELDYRALILKDQRDLFAEATTPKLTEEDKQTLRQLQE